MNETECAAAVKRHARALGFDLVGITTAQPPQHAKEFQDWLAKRFHGEMAYMARNAPKRIEPLRILSDARSIVVVGMNYHLEAVVPSGDSARSAAGTAATTPRNRIARYAWGDGDYHEVMGERLKQLSDFIRSLPVSGTQAHNCSHTEAIWYVDTGPILERDLAQRAGVGFIGKHTNLISRRFGNWIFLGAVLTNLQLALDPPEREYCGTCRRCIDACPTRAIVAPYQLDARLCISYLTIELKGAIPVDLRSVIGDRIFGCDDCLEVCPWNRFARESPVKEFQRRELPPLTEFLSWDKAKFKAFFRGTPIYRIKRRGFLRNVCVALGNIGDKSAVPPLQRALDDPEPLVREHAAWAIEQIRSRMDRKRNQ
ncbi:MAG TPA: tRNA epoxyqueuosine(34) reductase QueG [Verrucomicrobiae bacterium]|nr:tRNA epoxyqueuosine(34) reductase QueG [Verrucomicrobiae bacterium]